MEHTKRLNKGLPKRIKATRTTQTDLFDFYENENLIARLRQELAAAHATIQRLAYPCRRNFGGTGQIEAEQNEFNQFRVTSMKHPDEFLSSLNDLSLKENTQFTSELQLNHSVLDQHPKPVKPPQTRVSRPKTHSGSRPKRDTKKPVDLLPLPPISLPPPPIEKKRIVKREFKKRQHRKKSEVLDEILFKEQNRGTWESFYGSLKNNPAMMSVYLNQRSAKTAKSKKDWDWADSGLDSLDQPAEGLSYNQLETYLKEVSEEPLTKERVTQLFGETLSEFERLCSQLGLSETWMPIPSCSGPGLKTLLKACARLIRSRALTVKILQLIHEREDLMLKLMTMDQDTDAIQAQFQEVVKVFEHIEQTVVFWKHSGLPYTSFIYLGEDITEKIKDDLMRVCSIYSFLKVPDLYSNVN